MVDAWLGGACVVGAWLGGAWLGRACTVGTWLGGACMVGAWLGGACMVGVWLGGACMVMRCWCVVGAWPLMSVNIICTVPTYFTAHNHRQRYATIAAPNLTRSATLTAASLSFQSHIIFSQ